VRRGALCVALATLRPEPALTLAALRIVVAALVPIAPGFREGARAAVRDPALWIAPEGLGWFVRHVPINGTLAIAAQVIVAFAAACAVAGVRARLCFGVLSVVGFYLYAIAQLAGHVWHDMHLLWLCALLAASPCADVLAVDARRPLDAQAKVYAVALTAARLLLAAIYFFPGLRKLTTSGLAWALSDNLRNQLYWKWAEHGSIPWLRIDQVPWLLRAGGLGVLAFELSFVVLVSFRRTRTVAALAGVAFHLLSQFVFRIPFASLWLCYVALFDLRPLLGWLPAGWRRRIDTGAAAAPAVASVPDAPAWPATVVGGLLLVAAVVQGARGQMQSYPFACYPTFEWMAGSDMPDLLIERVDAAGARAEVTHARGAGGYRTQRQWGEIWSLAGVTAPVDARRLRAYYAALGGPAPAAGGAVIFQRVYRSVIPGEGGRITRRPVQLLTITP
jgi:hypothetical protein